MAQIWKWSLHVTDEQQISMPRGAQILSVQVQGGMPQVWALCDPEQPKEPRTILIIGTGHTIERPRLLGRHISTFQMLDGSLVWHAFESPTS